MVVDDAEVGDGEMWRSEGMDGYGEAGKLDNHMAAMATSG